jgi:hypothetical protein
MPGNSTRFVNRDAKEALQRQHQSAAFFHGCRFERGVPQVTLTDEFDRIWARQHHNDHARNHHRLHHHLDLHHHPHHRGSCRRVDSAGVPVGAASAVGATSGGASASDNDAGNTEDYAEDTADESPPLGCPTGTIALLKVDAEGDELLVLRGVSAEWWPRVEQVVVEVAEAETEVDDHPPSPQQPFSGGGITGARDHHRHGRGPVEEVVDLLRTVGGFPLVAAR